MHHQLRFINLPDFNNLMIWLLLLNYVFIFSGRKVLFSKCDRGKKSTINRKTFLTMPLFLPVL